MNGSQKVLDIYNDDLNKKREARLSQLLTFMLGLLTALVGLKPLLVLAKNRILSRFPSLSTSSVGSRELRSLPTLREQREQRVRDAIIHQAYNLKPLPPAAE